MEYESDETTCGGEGTMCRRPPFPIFPIVFPMIFPIGFALVLGRAGRRRQAALSARITSLEEKVERLTAESPPQD